MIVMPDLATQGYRTLPYNETLSLPHALISAAALARFHAAFANYIAARTARDEIPYNFLQEHGDIMTEPTFCDSPWLRAAAKLSYNLLKTHSNKFEQYPQNLEALLTQRYLEACATLSEQEDTLNVILHKDMWINNIMFKYDGNEPTNALLIDFQCLRYGPPAFDLMIFLYLTTEREFREQHEEEIIHHYFTIFSATLEEKTKVGLKDMKYNMEELVQWCERSRMFGMFEALGIFPFVLMEPLAAQQTFDDADTFVRYCEEDRSAPVLAHCRRDPAYLRRQLHVTEEFIERYIMQHSTSSHTVTT